MKDKYHKAVRDALIKDGWTVTNDPLSIESGGRNVYIDLAAERIITAERDTEKIAVEVKSFLKLSPLTDFYAASGQFLFYRRVLEREAIQRVLYLAIPEETERTFFQEPIIQEMINEHDIRLLVYDKDDAIITAWKE